MRQDLRIGWGRDLRIGQGRDLRFLIPVTWGGQDCCHPGGDSFDCYSFDHFGATNIFMRATNFFMRGNQLLHAGNQLLHAWGRDLRDLSLDLFGSVR